VVFLHHLHHLHAFSLNHKTSPVASINNDQDQIKNAQKRPGVAFDERATLFIEWCLERLAELVQRFEVIAHTALFPFVV